MRIRSVMTMGNGIYFSRETFSIRKAAHAPALDWR